MQKTKRIILPLLLAAVMVFAAAAMTACGDNVPATVPGQNTYIDDAKNSPADNDAKYVAYAVAGKLRKTGTFTAKVTGKTVAKKGFITYEQTIDNSLVKHGDEFYSSSESSSVFVNMKHEAFVKNSKVAYRNNGEEIKLAEADNYAEVYGVIPGEGLDGHILNDETILDAKYAGEENGLYKFEYVVDKQSGSAALKKQMKEFGGLSELPVFQNNSRLTLTVRKDWTPVSLVTEERYDISIAVLGSMSCSQTLTCEFTDFGAQTTIPDTEAFNTAMDSTPSVVDPGTSDSDPALEGLIGALVESDLAGGVALRGTLGASGLSLPIDIGASVDVEKLGSGNIGDALKLSVATSVAGVDARLWLTDNKLYINAAGRKFVAALPAPSFGGDIGGALTVVATDDGYRLTLTSAELIFGSLAAGNNIALAVDFYVPAGRVGAVSATLQIGNAEVTADLTLAEKKFTEPQDKSSYADKISQSMRLAVRLPLTFGLDVVADLDFSYDLADPDPLSALRADFRIDPMEVSQEGGYELKSALTLISFLAPSMGMELPPIISKIALADEIRVSYVGGGDLYLILSKKVTDAATSEETLKVFYVEKLASGSLLSATNSAMTADAETGSKPTALSLLSNIMIDSDENGIRIALAGEALAAMQALFDGLNDTLIAAMGDSGAMFGAMLGLGNKLAGVEFSVTKDESGFYDRLSLTLSVYKTNNDDPDKPLVGSFLEITLDFNGPLTAPIEFPDIDAAAEKMKLAEPITQKIDELSATELTEQNAAAFITEVNETEAAYDALAADVKIMVTNTTISDGWGEVSVFDHLREKAGKLLPEAA